MESITKKENCIDKLSYIKDYLSVVVGWKGWASLRLGVNFVVIT